MELGIFFCSTTSVTTSVNSSVNYVHGFASEGAANFENERVASESLRCSAEVVGWWGPDLGTTSAREKVPLDRK